MNKSSFLLQSDYSPLNEQVFVFTGLTPGTKVLKSFLDKNPGADLTIFSSETSSELEKLLLQYNNVSLLYEQADETDILAADRLVFFGLNQHEKISQVATEYRIPVEYFIAEGARLKPLLAA